MKVQSFLMAQSLMQPTDGLVTVSRIFDEIFFGAPGAGDSSTQIAKWPAFVAIAHLTCSRSEGTTHAAAIRVVDADEQDVYPMGELKPIVFVETTPGRPLRGTVTVGFGVLLLPCPGDYRLILLIDREPIADLPFFVSE